MNDSIFVTEPFLPPFSEYVDEIRDIWDTKILSNQGPKYLKFEKELTKELGSEFAPLFVNGHQALQIAIQALDLRPGKIITTPFTFSSTTLAIEKEGFEPVFCDVDFKTMTIDVSELEKRIDAETRAILPVHVYVIPCDVHGIGELASEYNLPVIYDAAHAFGERLHGKGIGTYGTLSMFSFHATKVFNSIEGGCVTTADKQLHERMCAIRQFGVTESGENEYLGTNAKLNEFAAAMGLCNLKYLGSCIEARKIISEAYDEVFAGVDGLRYITWDANVTPNYSYYPLIIDGSLFGCNRDTVVERLNDKKIYPRKYFFPLTSQMKYQARRFNIADTPIARQLAETVLCLPLYPGLSCEVARSIAETIIEMRG